MKYVSIACFALVAVHLCSPAWAGRGNAIAGGWDGTLTSGNQPSASATASASSGPAASTSLFSVSLSAGPIFSFGSGGGSSGNTGGAPSPEVNATLGLILVGGTVAFLHRRRIRKTVPQA